MIDIILAVLCVICMVLVVLKGIHIEVNFNYPEVKFDKMDDIYDEKGDEQLEGQVTMDDILKSVNEFMLDSEV